MLATYFALGEFSALHLERTLMTASFPCGLGLVELWGLNIAEIHGVNLGVFCFDISLIL